MNTKDDAKKRILGLLKKTSGPVSKREIARKIKLSPATTSKYVDILGAEGKVKIMDYGNINLVELSEKKKHPEK